MASRSIKDLVPAAWEKADLFQKAMEKAGIPFIFTCTRRSLAEQETLYAQGRTAPGRIVTWTMKSKHIDGMAFDIAILKGAGDHPTWDLKADVNDNEIPDYTEAGQIGESLGLTWGGRWHKPDYPHFQLEEEI